MTVRWGMIGCGAVAEVKSGPAFYRCPGSALAAVMRRDGAKAEDFARRHGVPRWYDDASRLIDDPQVDAVYIATPPGSHLEHALRVAAAGKACYVEKPMARSAAECDAMLEAFRRAGRPLWVAYYRRRLPRFVRAKALIDSGRLGRVTGCRCRMTRLYWADPRPEWRLDARESGGGLLLDVGSHALDVLDFLLGEFVEYGGAAATTGATDVEDNVVVHFRTARGVAGVVSCNFAAACREDRVEIDGTEGRLSFSVLGVEPLVLQRGDRVETFDEPTPECVQQPLVQSIVDEWRGADRCPSTGESAARTQRVMDAALEAYYGGRGDAFWERGPSTWPGRAQVAR